MYLLVGNVNVIIWTMYTLVQRCPNVNSNINKTIKKKIKAIHKQTTPKGLQESKHYCGQYAAVYFWESLKEWKLIKCHHKIYYIKLVSTYD